MAIKNWMNWIASDNPGTKGELQSGQVVNTFPTKSIRVPVNKENVLQYGIVKPEDEDLIVDNIFIKLEGNVIYKNRLLMLDIIANNEWKRPIYFTGGSFGNDDYLWMKDYLQLDGVAYKLVPIQTPVNPRNPFDMGRIDTDKKYEIVMGWDWGNMGDPNIYHDPETRKNSITYRSNMAKLVEALLNEGDEERAKEVIDLAMEKMPVEYYGYYTLVEPFISGYYQVGEEEKARQLWEQVATKYQENLRFYSGWDLERQFNYADNIITDMERYRSLVDLLFRHGEQDYAREKAEEFNSYLSLYPSFYEDEDEVIDIPRPTDEAVDRELRNPVQIDSLDSTLIQ
jgi:tetratricopeptide (TPR) repeat protein